MSTFIAVDFGGGSGRVMAGIVSGGTLKLEEVHRFPNRQIRLGKHLYWDFPALFEDMMTGLRLAAVRYDDVRSIGIDTWGVDYGLIDKAGNLMENPRCYRDESTQGMPEKVFRKIDRKKHYHETGIQVMPINTLFQLCVRKEENNALLDMAEHLLFMPDLFSYYLTGKVGNEYCIASTSEMLDARKRTWDMELIRQLGLPEQLFGELLMPGTVRGTLLPEVAEATGLPFETKVIAVGSHDTASAVHAIPYEEGKQAVSAFLSSGTWSLLGIELKDPVLTEEARLDGFTNEGGVGGTIRFLQNITGLWILQCLVSQWTAKSLPASYDYLIDEAEKAGITSVIDVDAPEFMHPADMEQAIADYCRQHGQQVPATQGEYVRCVLLSLAERYRRGVEQMNAMLPQPVERLHIIGGGCRNRLLNRLTEEALGIPVIAGPVEATAIGNILLQAETCGEIESKRDLTLIK